MGIPGRRLNLCVPEKLADHRQALAGGDSSGGEGVPEVVDADVIQFGARPDPRPEGLKVGQTGTGNYGWNCRFTGETTLEGRLFLGLLAASL